jgi:hypothetical protein
MSTTGNWRGPNIVKNGLILYLDPGSPNSYFDKTGTAIRDISGGINNGTLANSPAYSSANGGSILFDGVDDAINLTNNNLSRASGQDFVWNVWIKTPAVLSGYKMILSTNANYYYLALFDNKIAFDVVGIPLTRFGTLATNTWYNITIVRDNQVDYVYVNGSSIATRSNNGGYSGTMAIGKWNFNNTLFYNSNIAIVSIYNKSLTPAEVLQNFNAFKTRFGL